MNSVIQYISAHFVLVSGTTLALFFATSMILLIRSIGEKGERDVTGSNDIDIKAIEGAMKRVLQSQPVSVAAGSLPVATVASGEGANAESNKAGAGMDPAQHEAMQAALREREATIEQLRAELAQAKEVIAQMADASPIEGGGASTEDLQAYKSKVDELQARLMEYEIIEDDIADLSMYKDENARLKEEVDRLKAQGAAASASLAATAGGASGDSASFAAPPPVEVKFEKSDSFELDPNDDVMKEFAAAVNVQRAPPPAAESAVPAVNVAQADAFAQAVDPQAAIDALLMGDSGASSASPVEPVPEVAAEPAADLAADPQDAIDALLMDAIAPKAEPAPAPVVAAAPAPKPVPSAQSVAQSLAQASIDAFLMGDAAVPLEETPAPVDTNAAQAAIDELLSETPNTEKLLSEVESLESSSATDGDVLDEALDTEKLLAEVDSLSAGDDSSEFDKKAVGS